MSDNLQNVITILIADDEPMARAGIRAVLSQEKHFEIVGEAQDGFEVQKLIPELQPKIALLDYRMPGPGAYNLEKWIRENYPETTALVLTAHNHDAYLAKTIDAGIAGFLLKSEQAEQLILAIHRAAQGTVYFSDEQIERAQKWKRDIEGKWGNLSSREKEVLQQVALGKDNQTIAIFLHITPKTVEYHITNIREKLQLKSRDEMIVWMLKHQPDDPNI